ncbi:hypothetical protein [Actinomadura kijaniata]|uniref:hypothetical protein n=1 Tax=Actinomadura kijaniata TaxID=46161 RepID=UPI0008345BBE|nr:hypothetical protein [Actinomadura kijaniata]
MTEREDYSGEFDPDFRFEDLSKEALVRLVREYALIPQILDRSGLAAVGLRYGQQAVEEIAIEEWKGASPVYTERIREIMRIEGDGVSAIFKALQLDPGFTFSYMDVEYELVSETHGFFQLRSCGALLDVEPFGERSVRGMCHTIEDGTFDITAQAINPRARIRPVHRPPRVPAGRVPHCRWEVVIDDETPVLPEAEITRMTRGTTAARHRFPPLRDGTPHIPGDLNSPG